LRALLLCFFTCFSLLTHSEEAADLYRALVSVPDQTAESRELGIGTAFSQVLVKLTGDTRVLQLSELQSVIDNPRAFLNSVEFRDLADNPRQGSSVSGLEVSFDRQAVDRMIRNLQLPILPSNRPKLLIWMVLDDLPLGRRFVSQASQQRAVNDDAPQLLTVFEQAFKRRGMPYFFPSYDLEDQLSLSLEQAWSLDTDALNKASQRYPAEGWLALRLYRASSQEIRGAWVYQNPQGEQSNDFRGDQIGAVVDSAVDDIVDRFAGYYTYRPQLGTDQQLVEITGVNSYSAYQSMIERLQNLESVNSLQLHSVTGDRLVVVVQVEGGAERLANELAQSDWLAKVSGRDNLSDESLVYARVSQ